MDDRYNQLLNKLRDGFGKSNIFEIALKVGFTKDESETIVPYTLMNMATSIIKKAKQIDEASRMSSDTIAEALSFELIKIKDAMESVSATSEQYTELNKAYLMTHDRYVKHTGMDREEKVKDKQVDISLLDNQDKEDFLRIMSKLNV